MAHEADGLADELIAAKAKLAHIRECIKAEEAHLNRLVKSIKNITGRS